MFQRLSAASTAAACHVMDSYTNEASVQIPGMVYCAVNKDGEIIFDHGTGKSGLNETTAMTTDTIFWMASCTKLITSIACMQLVEQGILALDDSAQVESLTPELKDVKVLERDGNGGFRLVDKERSITLRMLLNHTGKRHNCAQIIPIAVTNSDNCVFQLALAMPSRISSYAIGHDPLALTTFLGIPLMFYLDHW